MDILFGDVFFLILCLQKMILIHRIVPPPPWSALLSLVDIWIVTCGNHLFTELPAEFSIDMLSGRIYRGYKIILGDIAHIVEELPTVFLYQSVMRYLQF